MLAKLVTYAPDRASAIAAQQDALEHFVIDGVAHNLLLLSAVMAHRRWAAGDLSTHFLDEVFPQGFAPAEADADLTLKLVCVAASIHDVVELRAWRGAKKTSLDARESKISVFLNRERFDLSLAKTDDHLDVCFDDRDLSLRCAFDWVPGRVLWQGEIDGHALIAQVRLSRDGYLLSTRGIEIETRILTRFAADLIGFLPEKREGDGSKRLLCPMPGLLKLVQVVPGQSVVAGETLCIIEAMKMEHSLRAETDGIVKAICAKAGELVGVDTVIMEFS
jgi:propionyl-CoA carboxylase alpha chain